MEQEEARQIRRRVLDHWLEVLSTLEWERQVLVDDGQPLSREYVDKCRICADQIRRDTKVKPVDQDLASEEEPAEVTAEQKFKKLKLKLVS